MGCSSTFELSLLTRYSLEDSLSSLFRANSTNSDQTHGHLEHAQGLVKDTSGATMEAASRTAWGNRDDWMWQQLAFSFFRSFDDQKSEQITSLTLFFFLFFNSSPALGGAEPITRHAPTFAGSASLSRSRLMHLLKGLGQVALEDEVDLVTMPWSASTRTLATATAPALASPSEPSVASSQKPACRLGTGQPGNREKKSPPRLLSSRT